MPNMVLELRTESVFALGYAGNARNSVGVSADHFLPAPDKA